MEKHIVAPWTKEQVDGLNWYQSSGLMQPFTCGLRHELSQTLVAEVDGWHCPDDRCEYTQAWAHAFMADRRQVEGMFRSFEFIASGQRPDGALVELRKANKALKLAEDELMELRPLRAKNHQLEAKLEAMRVELIQLNAVVGFYKKQREAQANATAGTCDGSWTV